MKELITKLDSVVFKVLKALYFFVSCVIIIAALTWAGMILLEVIDKGRLPIASDPRFIKGIKFKLGIGAFLSMVYGGIFWTMFTLFAFLLKQLKNYSLSFRIGSIGMIMNIFLLYLIRFSEAGRFILD